MLPNDPVPINKRSGCVCELSCQQCSATYIGQTGRQLGQRIKEHKSSAPSRIPSAVKEHSIEAHHTIDWDNIKILDREDREFPRQVNEAIQIRKHSPALNRDQGLEIPSIYNVIIRPIKGHQRPIIDVTPSVHHWSSLDEDLCLHIEILR